MNKLICAVAVLAVSTAQADTIYVDDDTCPGLGSGTVGDPYCSIQTAIDNAVDGDEVVVAPGTYTETINFLGKAITLRGSGGAEVTSIDGTGNFHVVWCVNGEGPDTVLDGFTITGGNATGPGGPPNYDGAGGGMLNIGTSPTMNDCIFSGNAAVGGGGGMNSFGGSPALINCVFNQNSAGLGGGMSGTGNTTLTNCTFSGNSADINGGGIWRGGNAAVNNCILWSNTPNQIFNTISATSLVSYSDVQASGGSGAWDPSVGTDGGGNIDADPLFVDPDNGDYRLSPNSPCIDAGDNTAVPEDITTDLDGNPRFLEIPETPDTGNGTLPIVDMGAYESLGGGCLAVTSQQIICHAEGTTFTVNVEGLNACTGGTTQVTFTGSGGAAGEELCFTALVNDGGICCSTEICVTIPDCSPECDLDGDGIVGILDYLALLDAWGSCSDCGDCTGDFDGDCNVGMPDFLTLLANWV